jgi:hypothetical protein
MRSSVGVNNRQNKKKTFPTSVRVTLTCKQLWDALAERMGLSNSAVLEILIREKAKIENIDTLSTHDDHE